MAPAADDRSAPPAVAESPSGGSAEISKSASNKCSGGPWGRCHRREAAAGRTAGAGPGPYGPWHVVPGLRIPPRSLGLPQERLPAHGFVGGVVPQDGIRIPAPPPLDAFLPQIDDPVQVRCPLLLVGVGVLCDAGVIGRSHLREVGRRLDPILEVLLEALKDKKRGSGCDQPVRAGKGQDLIGRKVAASVPAIA